VGSKWQLQAWCHLLPASIDLVDESYILVSVGKEIQMTNKSPSLFWQASCNLVFSVAIRNYKSDTA
jgi:hypothetical protein